MNDYRRNFLKNSAILLATAPLLSLNSAQAALYNGDDKNGGRVPDSFSSDEDFWRWIQTTYTVNPNILNLNNGGVSPQPKSVQDAFLHYYQLCNEGPAYYMWQVLDKGREGLRSRMVTLCGCSAEEITFNRNTTEALDIVIFGLQLQKGDEVVLTKQDYPNVMNAWKFREKRDGIKIVWIDLDLPNENEDDLVARYEAAFTSRTKIVNLTHIINWHGQIIPVRRIADKARARGIESMVDGAHTFAHLDYKISDLNCDYFGTSLHKWLCAPFGTGLLYVRKEKIKNLAPLFPNDNPDSEDIRKYEAQGTRNFASEQAIGTAISYHYGIGAKRKEQRLLKLKNYWASELMKNDRIQVKTSLKPQFACGLGLVSIEGMKPGELQSALMEKHKIFTTPIDYLKISGIRVTPHVYTSFEDLDRFIDAMNQIAKK
ncbi:MAG: aminotransferase class V-fold PLP-dependent enzyme [Candidatus Kapabacteria bacterium]|nr:aminotransferase class V-fold PLP-dependent enzyme [Candidatus Kapabacteria bacterium]